MLKEEGITLASAIEAWRSAELSDWQLRFMQEERAHSDNVNVIGNINVNINININVIGKQSGSIIICMDEILSQWRQIPSPS